MIFTRLMGTWATPFVLILAGNSHAELINTNDPYAMLKSKSNSAQSDAIAMLQKKPKIQGRCPH